MQVILVTSPLKTSDYPEGIFFHFIVPREMSHPSAMELIDAEMAGIISNLKSTLGRLRVTNFDEERMLRCEELMKTFVVVSREYSENLDSILEPVSYRDEWAQSHHEHMAFSALIEEYNQIKEGRGWAVNENTTAFVVGNIVKKSEKIGSKTAEETVKINADATRRRNMEKCKMAKFLVLLVIAGFAVTIILLRQTIQL